mgnify:CR=1 FL=1
MTTGRVTFDKGAKIARMEKGLDDPTPVLKQIGVLMVAESQRAFKEQKHGGKSWDERAPVNIFGIIADFAAGKRKPPNRRFETRPALRDTGALAKSIAFEVRGKVVEVGTNLDYAAVHQFGGKVESKTLTSDVRRLLWGWLKRQDSQMQSRIGWVLNAKYKGKKIEAEVPARPFIGITESVRKAVRKLANVEIFEVKP